MSSKYESIVACLCLFSLSMTACNNSTRATRESAAATAAIAENLAAADKLDGKEDHVIEKCYSCSLEMDGASSITTKFHDYTVHHCSEACKERFTEKADTIVSRTKIPATKSPN